MSYNFPNSPTEDQTYTPAGGPTYVYKAPRWVVVDEAIHEAPIDGKQYARKNEAWAEVAIPANDWNTVINKPATFPPTVPISWANITGQPATYPPTVPIAWTDVSGKPATFPPTLPIGWTDVSGKPATYPPTLPIGWTDISGKPTTYPPTVPIAWTDVSGKPTTYPPTLPITEADVTNLVSDLALKAPLSSPAFGGNPTAPTPSPGDNDTSIATTAFVSAAVTTATTPKLDASAYTAADVLAKTKTVDGTGSGLDADLLDGQDGAYYLAWLNITDKPTTYPPSLPIPSSGVTGLDAAQTAQDTAIGTKLDTSAYTAADVLTKIKTVDGTGSGLDADLFDGQTGSWYQDRTNHNGLQAESTVIGLVNDLAAKEPTITGGTVTQYWRGDKTWQEFPPTVATIADVAPSSPTAGQLWWNSTNGNFYIYYGTAWVQINAVGS